MELIPVEYKSQRIVTTKFLAEQYGTDENNIIKNFNSNKSRFVEGKHYYKLEGTELKDFKRGVNISNDPSIKFASVLILWTDRGAARHAKILDTDEAWDIYEQLEETYFKVQNSKINLSQLSPDLQMFKKIFDTVALQQIENKQIKHELDQTKKEVQNVKEIVKVKPTEQWRKDSNILVNKICMKTKDYKSTKEQIYKELDRRAGTSINTRLENMRKRLKADGVTETKIKGLNYLDVISQDKKLVEIYIAVIKETAISAGIEV